jgi:hypothetical protein
MIRSCQCSTREFQIFPENFPDFFRILQKKIIFRAGLPERLPTFCKCVPVRFRLLRASGKIKNGAISDKLKPEPDQPILIYSGRENPGHHCHTTFHGDSIGRPHRRKKFRQRGHRV